NAPQTPDRFIPFRRPSKAQRTSFQLSKSVDKLTDAEKLCRSRFVSPDPFLPPSRSELRTRYLATRPPNAPNEARTSNTGLRPRSVTPTSRRVSDGAVWGVGGSFAAFEGTVAVTDGRGGLFSSGTNAPLYTCAFQEQQDPRRELEDHERRLAVAFDVDQIERLVPTPVTPGSALSSPTSPPTASSSGSSSHLSRGCGPTVWQNNEWMREGSTLFLDAPQLKDDFYCSLLAYSYTANCLAVGLGNHVYLWSESRGVETPQSLNAPYQDEHGEANQSHVMSLSFSSRTGGKAILAVGRCLGNSGCLVLWSPSDPEPRFHEDFSSSISCVCFRPNPTRRESRNLPGTMVDNEDLLVGDENGVLYFYSVEWPNQQDYDVLGWAGALHLACSLKVHSQQICGLGWSMDGDFFASGSNDNSCYLFETKKVLHAATTAESAESAESAIQSTNASIVLPHLPDQNASHSTRTDIPLEDGLTATTLARHRFCLSAAIKAIAFCPFQRGLLALGGGSNDRCIHFYHTLSGAALATIDCAAQVTSLIWSTTRREIAATFGFANPEHAIRIAVFSWPTCEQVVAIPWTDEARALHAIGYPGGPNPKGLRGNDAERDTDDRRVEGEMWCNRTSREGCLVIATSDASIKFHEVWSEQRRKSSISQPNLGLLGGSAILESLHGVDNDEGDVIR
ncbi:WD40 repeat-like protein, partial [Eremomyces bilateralis CBS 781.70]